MTFVPGPKHPWRESMKLHLLRAEWRQRPLWSSDDSVGAFVARGGEVGECAPRALPEPLLSESVIVASDEWPLHRKLSHSSDMFFLNIDDWIGAPGDFAARHPESAKLPKQPASPVVERPAPPVVETPWRTPRKDHRHALIEAGHATLNRHAVQVVGITPCPGDTLPPQYRFKGRLIQLKRCLQTRPTTSGQISLWSFDRMELRQMIRWAWYEEGAHQPNTTTAFWARPSSMQGGRVQELERKGLLRTERRTITHRIVDGRSVPVMTISPRS